MGAFISIIDRLKLEQTLVPFPRKDNREAENKKWKKQFPTAAFRQQEVPTLTTGHLIDDAETLTSNLSSFWNPRAMKSLLIFRRPVQSYVMKLCLNSSHVFSIIEVVSSFSGVKKTSKVSEDLKFLVNMVLTEKESKFCSLWIETGTRNLLRRVQTLEILTRVNSVNPYLRNSADAWSNLFNFQSLKFWQLFAEQFQIRKFPSGTHLFGKNDKNKINLRFSRDKIIKNVNFNEN